MLNFERGTGMQGAVWNNTVVPADAWVNIFRKLLPDLGFVLVLISKIGKTESYKYDTYSPRLMGPAANYATVMNGMLKFSGLESNVCCILQSFVSISPLFSAARARGHLVRYPSPFQKSRDPCRMSSLDYS